MTARWENLPPAVPMASVPTPSTGAWRTDPATLPVSTYRGFPHELTVEQNGLRRVLDVEAGRHRRARLSDRGLAVFAIAALVLVVIPILCGYAELIQLIVWHWAALKGWFTAAGLAVVFVVGCRIGKRVNR